MNIGIDISQIVYEGTGVGRFTKGLVNAICNYDQKNNWHFLFSSLRRQIDPKIEATIKNSGGKLVKYHLPPTLVAFLWNNAHIFELENIFNNLDWFITSDWSEPPAKKIKKATIVHDLAFLRYPEAVAKNTLLVQKKRLELVKKESSLIFNDSLSTKNDLIELLGFSDKKIQVVYPGVEKIKITNNAQPRSIRPYILAVGKVEPRKNLNRLITAFNEINNENIDLIIVGPKGWEDLKLQSADNIHFLGFVDDQELANLYQNCLFFVYPSLWEGFGYPVIEAMQMGAPVTCSNSSSIKEIVGDNALTFDPIKTESIKKALLEMINNQKLREELIIKGKKHSQSFTWENYYNKFITTLNKFNNCSINKLTD